MSHPTPENDNVQIATDAYSLGEARIERIKAAPRSQFHFGLVGLFWAVIGVSIIMALPRIWGLDYGEYFILWYIVLYGFSPTIAWAMFATLPANAGSLRLVISAAATATVVLPTFYVVAFSGGPFAQIVIGSCLIFWLPQIVCILLVRYVVFGGHRRRRVPGN